MFLPVYTQVPPNILDSLSTESTVAVRENQNITLTCKADGYPTPKLMWKREDGQNININRHKKGEHTRLVLDLSNQRSFKIRRSFEKEMLYTIDKNDSQVFIERSFNFSN